MNNLLKIAGERVKERFKDGKPLSPEDASIIGSAIETGKGAERRLASLNKKLDDVTKAYNFGGEQVKSLRKIGKILGLSDLEGRRRTTRNASAIVSEYLELIYVKMKLSCGAVRIGNTVIDTGTEPESPEPEPDIDAIQPPKSPATKKDAIAYLTEKHDFPSTEACRQFLLRNMKTKYRRKGKVYK